MMIVMSTITAAPTIMMTTAAAAAAEAAARRRRGYNEKLPFLVQRNLSSAGHLYCDWVRWKV